jgi:hypothetical protein
LQEDCFIFATFHPFVAANVTVLAVTSVSVYEVWALIQFIRRQMSVIFIFSVICLAHCQQSDWLQSVFLVSDSGLSVVGNHLSYTHMCFYDERLLSQCPNIKREPYSAYLQLSSLSDSHVLLTAFHAVVIRDTLFEHLTVRQKPSVTNFLNLPPHGRCVLLFTFFDIPFSSLF